MHNYGEGAKIGFSRMVGGFLRDLRTAWRLWGDDRVPMPIKLIPLLSLAYVLWPLDLLADPILGLGQFDDLAVVLLGLRAFLGLCSQELVNFHRDGGSPSQPDSHEVVDTTYRVLDDDDD